MPNQQRISKETMHQLSEQLRQKAQQQKPYTVQELLDQAKPYFQKMLKHGFSLQEIQQLLSAQGIIISEAYLSAFITGKQPPKIKKSEQEKILAAHISDNQVQVILAELQQQSKIQKGLTRQELLMELFEPITAMLKARYDFDDIAEFFNSQGVSITASTLKSYYKTAKRQRELPNSKPHLIQLPLTEKRPLSASDPQLDLQSSSQSDVVNRFPEAVPNQFIKEFNL